MADPGPGNTRLGIRAGMGLNRLWSGLRAASPLHWFVRWADWFEARGVYVPGEDSRSLSPWRDFGWLIAAWLIVVSAFVVFFAVAS